MDIGNRIKKQREIYNISQEELADRIFVSRQTISNWENNKSYPDIKSISLLCNIFNISIDDFIGGDVSQMKKMIDEKDKKGFAILSYVFSIELIIMVISAYPLIKYAGIIGISLWILFTIITICTAITIERFKKHYDIQTYKEIVAFYENKPLSHDDKKIEFGKRWYQKLLLALICSIIALFIMVIMKKILG